LEIVFWVILIYIIKGIFNYYHNYITGFVSTNISNDVRKELYKILINKDIITLEKKSYGDNIKSLTDDINKLNESIFSFISEFIPSLIMMFFTLLYIFYTNWKLAFTVIFLIPSVGFIINFFTRLIKEKSENIQKKISDTYSKINEDISNILIIKLFNIEDKKITEFDFIQAENNKEQIELIKIMASQPSITGTVQTIVICLIVAYARFEMLANNIPLSELLAFATAMTLTIEPVIFITKSTGIITKNYPIIKNIDIFLKNNLIKEEKAFYEKEKKLESFENFDMKINNLNFSYNEKNNIFSKDLDLDLKTGEILFISSENGKGKTTLTKIIMSIYENFLGILEIGNKSIKDYKREIYLKNIKAVFNDPFLFNRSIKENIFLGYDYLQEDLEKVCSLCLINDFLDSYNEKYDFIIGYNGNNLSSGQKQRIAIARAIISKPKILILDEATSSIDIESEKVIYHNIREFLPDSTLIIINHRKGYKSIFNNYKELII